MGFFQVAVFTYCGRSVDFVGSFSGPTVDPGCSVVVGGGVTVVQLSHIISSPIALKLKGNRDIPLIRFNSRFKSNHISQNEIVRVVVDHSVEAVLMTVTSSVRRVS
jgi:type 1 fimbria pilin